MNRFTFRWTAFAAALLAPGLSYSQVSCTREGLQAAADLYIAAQAKRDTGFLRCWRTEWRQHCESPLRGRQDDWSRGGLLYFRRRFSPWR